jgi:hypothetical protein
MDGSKKAAKEPILPPAKVLTPLMMTIHRATTVQFQSPVYAEARKERRKLGGPLGPKKEERAPSKKAVGPSSSSCEESSDSSSSDFSQKWHQEEEKKKKKKMMMMMMMMKKIMSCQSKRKDGRRHEHPIFLGNDPSEGNRKKVHDLRPGEGQGN